MDGNKVFSNWITLLRLGEAESAWAVKKMM